MIHPCVFWFLSKMKAFQYLPTEAVGTSGRICKLVKHIHKVIIIKRRVWQLLKVVSAILEV